MPRIHLSPPDVGAAEREYLLEAFESNWIAPVGPHVDAFERELATKVGVGHVAALSSGTAALHLALQTFGVGPGDVVLVSDLTFAASVNAVRYLGATPVFVDSEWATWNVDPALLVAELDARARRGCLPAAVVVVDVYGQCADYDGFMRRCRELEVPVVEDAAEALGASYMGRSAGSLADAGVLSFNGNKIITTSGGGALLSDDAGRVERARYLSTQAREPVPHYEHHEVGYNYRLSNLLAALGRAQLHGLDDRVGRRRSHNRYYRELLGDVDGVAFMPDAPHGCPTNWLTVIVVDEEVCGVSRDEVRLRLEGADIETRPTWMPMHQQPVFAACEVRGGDVAAAIFRDGLCLPSGSGLTDDERERVGDELLRALRQDDLRQ